MLHLHTVVDKNFILLKFSPFFSLEVLIWQNLPPNNSVPHWTLFWWRINSSPPTTSGYGCLTEIITSLYLSSLWSYLFPICWWIFHEESSPSWMFYNVFWNNIWSRYTIIMSSPVVHISLSMLNSVMKTRNTVYYK